MRGVVRGRRRIAVRVACAAAVIVALGGFSAASARPFAGAERAGPPTIPPELLNGLAGLDTKLSATIELAGEPKPGWGDKIDAAVSELAAMKDRLVSEIPGTVFGLPFDTFFRPLDAVDAQLGRAAGCEYAFIINNHRPSALQDEALKQLDGAERSLASLLDALTGDKAQGLPDGFTTALLKLQQTFRDDIRLVGADPSKFLTYEYKLAILKLEFVKSNFAGQSVLGMSFYDVFQPLDKIDFHLGQAGGSAYALGSPDTDKQPVIRDMRTYLDYARTDKQQFENKLKALAAKEGKATTTTTTTTTPATAHTSGSSSECTSNDGNADAAMVVLVAQQAKPRVIPTVTELTKTSTGVYILSISIPTGTPPFGTVTYTPPPGLTLVAFGGYAIIDNKITAGLLTNPFPTTSPQGGIFPLATCGSPNPGSNGGTLEYAGGTVQVPNKTT